MRHFAFAVAAITLFCSPAFSETFDFAGGHVVTHRGGSQPFIYGVHDLDKPNVMTCVSEKGCSLVIQTQVNNAENSLICTIVDGVAAAPPCIRTGGDAAATTFQGAPALAKGDHTVQTKLTVFQQLTIAGFQVVYTMYEYQ